jgi:hypothetical protein
LFFSGCFLAGLGNVSIAEVGGFSGSFGGVGSVFPAGTLSLLLKLGGVHGKVRVFRVQFTDDIFGFLSACPLWVAGGFFIKNLFFPPNFYSKCVK